MILELLCRYPKELSQKELDALELELETDEIIKGDAFNKESEKEKRIRRIGKFEYGPFVLNVKDIMTFNYVDRKHTTLRFYGGIQYTFKINYTEFKSAYQALSGMLINTFIEDQETLAKKTTENTKPIDNEQ